MYVQEPSTRFLYVICFRAGRRAASNQIRGPQSALTDFLASNNISAAQISADYERRQREARQQHEQEVATDGELIDQHDHGESLENVVRKKKRKRQEEKALARIRESKDSQRQKKRKDEGSNGEDDDFAWDMYTKKKPLPGQLENCETCEKRFTVTAYSKTGPDGGLLCTRCSKEQEDQKKKIQKSRGHAVSRDKRRHVQSILLDGIVQIGSKTLQELCIKVLSFIDGACPRICNGLISSRRLRTISMMFTSLVTCHILYSIG